MELQPIKILRPAEWQDFKDRGWYDGSSDDQRDGFIHMSFKHQILGTLKRYFTDVDAVILAYVAPKEADHYRLEISRNGEAFPHYYGALSLGDIQATALLVKGAGFEDKSVEEAISILDDSLQGAAGAV